MELKQVLSEERAVSPVIGVILMVAITVVLAAVVGTYVLDLSENVGTTPQAKFDFDYRGGTLTVTHGGGDPISAAELNVTSTTEFGYYDGSWSGSAENATSISFAEMGASDEVSAGTSVVVRPASGDFDAESVRVVWQDADTGKSATLARWSGPGA